MTESDKDLARKRAVRGGNRSVITKLCNEAEAIFKKTDATDGGRLDTIHGLLEQKLKLVQSLDDEIVATCAVEEIEAEIEEAEVVTSRILDTKKAILDKLQSYKGTQKGTTPPSGTEVPSSSQQQGPPLGFVHMPTTGMNATQGITPPPNSLETGMDNSFVNSSMPLQHQSKTRLPKLTLRKFKGEITEWQTFWDIFDSAINKNQSLNAIDKFNYLKSLLEGPAQRAIQGLTLSEANYQAAINILQQRFGRRQQIITSHMDELLKISACTTEKASQLRFIYDKISVNVRGLEALGVNAEQYGSLLIPIIMSKLPQQVRVQVARLTTQEVWEISELLEIIRKEVDALEINEGVKVNNPIDKPKLTPRPPIPSATALLVGTHPPSRDNRIQCVYCNESHYSASCQRVIDKSARLDILKRDRRCFVCLKSGHNQNRCEGRKCRRCHGNHHQSLCNQSFQPARSGESPRKVSQARPAQVQNTTAVNSNVTAQQTENEATNETPTITTTARVKSKGHVLLQTATATAKNEDRSKYTNVRILFDSGSQRSYVTNSLKSRLGLKPVKSETLHLNTFGEDKFRKQSCDVVKLRLQNRESEEIQITALSYPVICTPLNSKVETTNFPHLEGLQLADNSADCDLNDRIDVLIGSDFYWDIVTGQTVRGESGPTAVESKFGWLLSGPLYDSANSTSTVSQLIISGDVQSLDFVDRENDELTNALQQFWETESIGIRDNDGQNRNQMFPNEIRRVGDRYDVKLPWKEGRQPIPDNYDLCRNRLRSMQYKFHNEPELLREYDNIIKDQLEKGIVEEVPQDDKTHKCKPEVDNVHYMPHHAVVRRNRDTTKLRVVYDGSAKKPGETHSINDLLETGQNYNYAEQCAL